jgi:predicted TIM-barrel fold metal-dependent hydrolase
VDDELMAPWVRCLLDAAPGLPLFDCHTHVGVDPDGSHQSLDELRAALDVTGARAVVFPFAVEAGGYRAANDRLLDEVAGDDRVVPFCRVDPVGDGTAEVERALGRGAAGIKLHPRAERFALSDPAATRVFAAAAERRVPVIVHAGRGIPSLGRDALDVAARHPDAPLVLAHAAVADLAWIWSAAAGLPNLLFDTAWWNSADLLALFALVPPGRILFASDTPYGRPAAAAAVALRVALAAGLTAGQIGEVFGGQLARILAHEPPRDLGPAPGGVAPMPDPLLERVHALLVGSAALALAGAPPGEFLDLARLACRVPADHPAASVAASVVALLDRRERYLAAGPAANGPRPPGAHFLFVAASVARLPGLPLPTLPGGC